MTRIAMLMLVGLLGLAGCAQLSPQWQKLEPSERGFDIRQWPAPRPTLPLVYVANSYLVVNQEPIRLWRNEYLNGRVTIHWQLPADTGYTWPTSSAATFKPVPPGLRCVTQGKLLSCSFEFQSKAEYKYSLTALENGKPLPSLDPVIINME